MRTRLGWDVFFVMEHEELRRARDIEHYRLARQLGRTLLTQDRDYERDAEFPPAEGAGVIVFIAPDERRLCELLARADRELFRCAGALPIPLEGRKMRWHIGAAEIIGDAPPAVDHDALVAGSADLRFSDAIIVAPSLPYLRSTGTAVSRRPS